jgi:hypothetical protein
MAAYLRKNEEVRLNTCYLEFVTAYFETWSRRKSGLEKSPNPDSKKPDSSLRKPAGLTKENPGLEMRKKRIRNKDSVYENGKVFCKGLLIVNMINDDLFITITL